MSAAPAAAGRLAAILVAERAGAPLRAVASVRAIAGRGLEGDRYAAGAGAFSRFRGARREVSLVAAETAAALGLDAALLRRNLVTEGVELAALAGARFAVGAVVLEGLGDCAPCAYLARLTGRADLVRELRGRGGLRARVVTGGELAVGDPVRFLERARGSLP